MLVALGRTILVAAVLLAPSLLMANDSHGSCTTPSSELESLTGKQKDLRSCDFSMLKQKLDRSLAKLRVQIDTRFEKLTPKQRESLRAKAEQGSAEHMFAYGLLSYLHTDYKQADTWFRKAIEHEDIASSRTKSPSLLIGYIYLIGHGVVQDFDQSAKWFRIPAEQGQADAQRTLAVLHLSGQGVPKDYRQAAYWYRKAAEQEDEISQYSLGNRYFYGEGVAQDMAEATAWWRKAAEKGHIKAQYYLAVAYQRGAGVEQSHERAVAWYRKAAEQGHQDSQCQLAAIYANGMGVQKDKSEADMWLKKAGQCPNIHLLG